MKAPTQSYLKVPYDLRPAKQIERRMILDAFQRLAQGGFEISEYQYTGMGSLYFVDFILFHRYLGLRKMWNVEFDEDIKKRVLFNRPYKNIDVYFEAIGDVIPRLSRDRKHILWMDYDDLAHKGIIHDVVNAATVLSPGSVLLVTVDAEPPDGRGPKAWRNYFRAELGPYCDPSWKLSDFSESNLAQINASILSAAIKQGLSGRDIRFLPLFNFVYADGHEMLTIGGVIGADQEERALRECDFDGAFYLRRSLEDPPYRIRQIRLTRKERIYLDASMPAKAGWTPANFELNANDVAAYTEMYRFFPTYAELLL